MLPSDNCTVQLCRHSINSASAPAITSIYHGERGREEHLVNCYVATYMYINMLYIYIHNYTYILRLCFL